MLIISWLATAAVIAASDEERSQAVLLEQAQQLLDDKLYMRAITKYQEAIQKYNTDKNSEIEDKILAVYKEAGKTDTYNSLIEDRIEEKKAHQSEYMELARMYIEEGSIKKAIEILKPGIAQYNDEEMIALYEQIRYGTKKLDTTLTEIKMTNPSGYIPYYDGSFWGYTDSSSASILSAQYEEALPFSGKYAVVKINGVYTLIDSIGDWYAIDKTGLEAVTGSSGACITAKKNGKYGLYTNTFSEITGAVYEDAVLSANGLCFAKMNGKWGVINQNGEQVIDFIYDDIARNSCNEVFANGFAVVKDSGGYFIINESGEEIGTARYANAKGIEEGWIAVCNQNGRWGFTDGISDTVIDYKYEDAYSFSSGVAAVKRAGKWGYINKRGDFVIETDYDEAMPFQKGQSIVKSLGVYSFLTLVYYEYF